MFTKLFVILLTVISVQKSWTAKENYREEIIKRDVDVNVERLLTNGSEHEWRKEWRRRRHPPRDGEGQVKETHSIESPGPHISEEMPGSHLTLEEKKDVVDQGQNFSFKFDGKLNNNHDYVFEWRKREDAYKKYGPEKSPYSLLLLLRLKSDSGINGRKMIISGEEGEPMAMCTGSLLTKEWILTASHCLSSVNGVLAYAGGMSMLEVGAWMTDPVKYPLPPTSQVRFGVRIVMHPRYDNTTFDFDVGLVRVRPGFNLTTTVATAPLARTPWRSEYHSYTTCSFTGFGLVQVNEENVDDDVRKTQLLDVKKPCICSFRMQIDFGQRTVAKHICTKPREDYGLCEGDSGGGLLCDGHIRGVASFITKMQSINFCLPPFFFAEPRCGDPNTITIFQDVCPHLPWINNYTKVFKEGEFSKDCHSTDDAVRPSSTVPRLFHLVLIAMKITVY